MRAAQAEASLSFPFCRDDSEKASFKAVGVWALGFSVQKWFRCLQFFGNWVLVPSDGGFFCGTVVC